LATSTTEKVAGLICGLVAPGRAWAAKMTFPLAATTTPRSAGTTAIPPLRGSPTIDDCPVDQKKSELARTKGCSAHE
jgi:hypothetical protein